MTIQQTDIDAAFAELTSLLHKRKMDKDDLQALQLQTQTICNLLARSTPALAKKYEIALRDAISLLESTEMDLTDYIDQLKLANEKA